MKHRWMSLLTATLLLGGCSIHIGAPERVNMTLQGVGIGATAAEAKKNALDDVL
jgi:hypothetical protein